MNEGVNYYSVGKQETARSAVIVGFPVGIYLYRNPCRSCWHAYPELGCVCRKPDDDDDGIGGYI